MQYYAALFLYGEAVQFYDNFRSEPNQWIEFKNMIIKRFEKKKARTPNLIQKYLARRQYEAGAIKEYTELMCNTEKADIEESLIVQYIIAK